MQTINIFWFRRDLRLQDNAALYHALKSGKPILPLFIFDRAILDKLEDKKDARVHFIHQTLQELNEELQALGSSLLVKCGTVQEIWKELLSTYSINAVYANRDYEPYAKKRDLSIQTLLETNKTAFHTYKDHIIFEKEEVLKKDGTPYTVFTPYSRKWKEKLTTKMVMIENEDGNKEAISYYFQSYPSEKYFSSFQQIGKTTIPTLQEMGFEESRILIPSKIVTRALIKSYDKTRNFPAIKGTSQLGIHFRFGTISIREKARHAQQLNVTYLNELIWRDFYSMILQSFPHVVGNAFREKYEYVEWRNNTEDFEKWCAGQTGYPIVDAGMRELNATGYMHNRVRMIVASFLTKHLLIDWRWGEAYFAKKLLDFDLASNSGGWQWAAGCGTDAAPYFRIFNPYSQQQKFDKEFTYIKKWIPEYGTSNYPEPIVDHKIARERCLAAYKTGLAKAEEMMVG